MVSGLLDVNILATDQTLTGSFVDFGLELDTSTLARIALFLDIDINDSQDFRIRALGKLDSGSSDEYLMPIHTVFSNIERVEDRFYEYVDDVDQQIVLQVELENIIPHIQFQIEAGTVGASPGTVSAKFTVIRSTAH